MAQRSGIRRQSRAFPRRRNQRLGRSDGPSQVPDRAGGHPALFCRARGRARARSRIEAGSAPRHSLLQNGMAPGGIEKHPGESQRRRSNGRRRQRTRRRRLSRLLRQRQRRARFVSRRRAGRGRGGAAGARALFRRHGAPARTACFRALHRRARPGLRGHDTFHSSAARRAAPGMAAGVRPHANGAHGPPGPVRRPRFVKPFGPARIVLRRRLPRAVRSQVAPQIQRAGIETGRIRQIVQRPHRRRGPALLCRLHQPDRRPGLVDVFPLHRRIRKRAACAGRIPRGDARHGE
ncbi:MAG: hypothetical protein BWZ10_01156 [candidate division BRC1 bacterium ADurb.BinA364]|nr:MAG: hypothetical protein BWZ10_01156 [candidate division BRC1 bacterium ADurb.BinA364]